MPTPSLTDKALGVAQAAARAGEDIRPVGSDIKRGQAVLQAGDMLAAPEIGILATVGAAKVQVSPLHAPHPAVHLSDCMECSTHAWSKLAQDTQGHHEYC